MRGVLNARDRNQLLGDAERVREHVLIERIAGVVEQAAVAKPGWQLEQDGLRSSATSRVSPTHRHGDHVGQSARQFSVKECGTPYLGTASACMRLDCRTVSDARAEVMSGRDEKANAAKCETVHPAEAIAIMIGSSLDL